MKKLDEWKCNGDKRMEWNVLIITIAIILIVIITVCFILWFDYKQKKQFRAIVKNNFGKTYRFSKTEIKEENLLYLISKYGKTVSDQTIKDLCMYRVFHKINHTYSSLGEESLFWLLNNPLCSAKELNERETFMKEFKSNESLRNLLIEFFMKIGKNNSLSIYEYMDYICGFNYKIFRYNFIAIIMLIGSVLLAIATPKVGVFILMVTISINIITYFKNKNIAGLALENISMIEKIMNAATKINDLDNPIFSEHKKIFLNAYKIKRFFRGSSIIISNKT
ncbi:hypothetical protein, partial [Anaerosporobacter sp.]|uniref:hypothetical protein n=1 Tax=Anaerosporobacter sp. TaxID=1872529 RepID=UPI00286F4443